MIEPSYEPVALPPAASTLLDSLADVLGQPRFLVVGGAPLDLLQDPPRRIKDVDVALPHDPTLVEPCLAHLRSRGCAPQGSIRRYWINLDQPVLMIDVQWGDYVIDLNFVDDMERIPQFDIEGVVWRYPELDYLDLYEGFSALERRTVRPVHGLDQNNPYLLMNRMIRLAAKYDLNMAGNPDHQGIITGLSTRIASWQATDDFHGRQALEAHHRSIAGSSLRSSAPDAYLADLAESGAIEHSVPELHRLVASSQEAVDMLTQASTADEFWATACSLMPADDADELSSRLATAARTPAMADTPSQEDR